MENKIIGFSTTLMTLMLLLLSFCSEGQILREVQNSFKTFKENVVQDKLFVHTDKDVYLSGEIVWFKIYCVNADDHHLLNLSKVAYIELLDEHHQVITQAKVALKNGTGNGSVLIPVSITNGNYQFRAYTNWMKNAGPDFYFEKTLTLINPLKSPALPVVANADTLDLQFFPEGGNLVTGITSKVAFKAVDNHGKGIALNGAVLNQKNDTVARFNTYKFGMGSFLFTPVLNDAYRAVFTTGKTKRYSKIPEIYQQGYTLLLTDNGTDQLDLAVKSSGITDGNVYLFVHTRQVIKAAQTAGLKAGITHFTLSKQLLGEGVSHLTIFNQAKQPVCERLYFKAPTQRLFIEAKVDQQEYKVRKKVNIEIATKNGAGQPRATDLSMAVYQLNPLQDIADLNIFNYLWLKSELKGNIESPDYYFKLPNAETAVAIDNLMLTQGWRRFSWTDVLAPKTASFSYLPEYKGHIITAKINTPNTQLPAKSILSYLSVPGKRVQFYPSLSDSSGTVFYHTKDFYGPNELILQTNPILDSTHYNITVQSPFSKKYSTYKLPAFSLNQALVPAIQQQSLAVQVTNSYSALELSKFYTPVLDSVPFYGQPSRVYQLDNFVRFTTMEEDLREYVKEVNVIKSGGKFHLKVLFVNQWLEGGDPLVLLDGVPIFSMDKVMTIDPLKVKTLEVLPASYYYGPRLATGIFRFTSYKEDLGGLALDPQALVLDYDGMQLQRKFYSPVYDTAESTASRLPDFRNLLYWNPEITKADKNSISFYTSDQPGKYIGIVQGISAAGDVAVQQFTFEVK